VVVAADVGLHLVAFHQLTQAGGITQHVAGAVAALGHRLQGQVPHHQPPPRRAGRRGTEAAVGPAHLFRRHHRRRGVPHQHEQILLTEGIEERKAAAIHERQTERLFLPRPKPFRLGPIACEQVAVPLAQAGGIVVAHRRRKRQAGAAQRHQHGAIEAGPHRLQLRAAQAGLLARHHVAGAEHQIGLQRRDQGHPPVHLLDVGGGAVAGVQIADQHHAQITAGRQAQPGRQAAGCFRGHAAQGAAGQTSQPQAAQGQELAAVERGGHGINREAVSKAWARLNRSASCA